MDGNEIIFLVQDSAEDGYEAKALGYSIFTEADTISELREMVRDAVACHFDDGEHPALIRPHYPTIPSTLSKKGHGFTRRRPEPVEGIKSAKSASRFSSPVAHVGAWRIILTNDNDYANSFLD